MATDNSSAAFAHTRQALAAELAGIDGLLPGTITVRQMRCGKASCVCCKADLPTLHGPYIQWTRTVAGQTVTRRLTPEQHDRYKPWFDNAARLKELTAKLQAASIAAVEAEQTNR